jgi:hypothetical protein
MRSLPFITAILMGACFSSCVHKSPGLPVTGSSLFPEEFVISQRVLWTFREKDYDFVAYVVREQQELNVQMFNDLGGKIFEFSIDPSGKIQVKKKPEHMPERFITKEIGRDLWVFYNLKAEPGPQKIEVDQTVFEFTKDSEPPRSATISNRSQKSILKIEILSIR